MRCLRRIVRITWKDKVTNNEVFIKAGLPFMYTLIRQRRLLCLSNVLRWTTVASLKTSSTANWQKKSVWSGDRNFVIRMCAKGT